MTRPFYGFFQFPLAAGAIAASLTRINLAAIGQQFLQRWNVLVINVFGLTAAEPALRLLSGSRHSLSLVCFSICPFFCSFLDICHFSYSNIKNINYSVYNHPPQADSTLLPFALSNCLSV